MNRQEFESKIHKGAVIWGKYRYCNDVEYVFRHAFGSYFDNVLYIKNENDIDVNCSELQELSKQYELIIVCVNEADWDKIKNDLSERIVWVEDLFGLLDEVNVGWFDRNNPSDKYHHIPNKKIALWGLNDACQFFLNYQQNIIPDCIIDRDLAKGGMYSDIPVLAPDDIEKWNDYYVLIMCRDRCSVRDWLLSKGMKEIEDFLCYGYYVNRLCVSEMMRKVMYDTSKQRINCEIPFSRVTFEADGSLNLCNCGIILSGNMLYQDVAAAWNSVAAVIIRLSMINRTYTFCKGKSCHFFPFDHLETDVEPPKNAYYKEAPTHPKYLKFNSSKTCNLYCETCRRYIMVDDISQEQRSMQIVKKAVPLLHDAESITLAGYGEVFASQSYKYIIENMKELHHKGLVWDILSNGILMTKQKVDYILTAGG